MTVTTTFFLGVLGFFAGLGAFFVLVVGLVAPSVVGDVLGAGAGSGVLGLAGSGTYATISETLSGACRTG